MVVDVAVEVSPVGTKPPAAVDEHISKDGRHDSGDVAPSSTKTSSMIGRSGGLDFTPKLVELLFGPCSTRRAEELSPCIACTAVVFNPPCARESSCLRARLPP